ncbi:[citrate (pro-3S)-lyase] ligase [Lactobacillus sp. ESL0731]|uniref:[citrate (pro-3S)-lyase] ligase n=1 Tax=unclassified Lactobacillus TaxID=2620435 RepID=UPI0023F705EB|nr:MULTISPECIES: [citrate (pro-3S)-lyase] ligase [unclassified Lactobacillus]WEV50354.1 [citrate (pro-3S)-lyase] ligase [Lactobacillus sp. ESL0700]WEV61483.1 [citrate (pro-3S)-lyase] ligase [Lactobacillus sp. ESL0731]
MDQIVDLYLNDQTVRTKWEKFLIKLGLHDFSSREVNVIDHTLGIINDEGELVGTGSVAGNVLKYIAVCNQGATPGSRFNQMVTALQQYQFNRKIFHNFVFTKTQYSTSFQHLGFTELAHTDVAAFLESGTPDVNDYLATIPQVEGQKAKKVAAIVMNANPFTLGHQRLAQLASQENDLVYIFVVATDASLFKTEERMQLVKSGTADLKNVHVVSGSDYLVSQATFPAYFLKSPDDLIKTQTTIDARVFKNIIAPKLAINRRYLGTEPFSHTTNFYNKSLINELSPQIEVKIVPRFSNNDQVITATRVRQLIKIGDLAAIKLLVPNTTMDFIKSNQKVLQTRIQKGMNINGN